MNILLIHAESGKWYSPLFKKLFRYPPLGLLYISSFLKMHGYTNIKLIDYIIIEFSKSRFIHKLKEFKPDVVGILLYAESYDRAIMLSKLIKEICIETKVIFGGAFATFVAEDILKNKCVDFVVLHEGENTILELIKNLESRTNSYKNIAGLAFRQGDKVIINPRREYIKNLDSLPFPDISLVDMLRYYGIFCLSTSRGCPGNCVFCSARAMWGPRYRCRSAESVFSELFWYYKKYRSKVKYFYFADDTFTAKQERVFELSNLLNKSPISVPWYCESRVDVLTEDMLKVMRGSGCYKIHLGVESGNQRIINSIRKNINLEKVEQVLEYAKKFNIKILCSFVLGLPEDTTETMDDTIRYIRHIKQKYGVEIAVSMNIPFPGTYEYNNLDSLGLKIHIKKWSNFTINSAIISGKYFSRQVLQNYYCRAIKSSI